MFFDPDIKTRYISLIYKMLIGQQSDTYSLSYSYFGLLGVGCCGLVVDLAGLVAGYYWQVLRPPCHHGLDLKLAR